MDYTSIIPVSARGRANSESEKLVKVIHIKFYTMKKVPLIDLEALSILALIAESIGIGHYSLTSMCFHT